MSPRRNSPCARTAILIAILLSVNISVESAFALANSIDLEELTFGPHGSWCADPYVEFDIQTAELCKSTSLADGKALRYFPSDTYSVRIVRTQVNPFLRLRRQLWDPDFPAVITNDGAYTLRVLDYVPQLGFVEAYWSYGGSECGYSSILDMKIHTVDELQFYHLPRIHDTLVLQESYAAMMPPGFIRRRSDTLHTVHSLWHGSISGTVIDSATGKPLHSACTAPCGGDMRAVTDSCGRYRLDDIPPGTYRVYCWRDGYHFPRSKLVTVHPGATTASDFSLSPDEAETE